MGDVETRPSEHPQGHLFLGKLEVIRRIGGGGMGVVYEVEHRLTGHRRALKLVRARYADRPRFMKRLLREAKVAGTLGTERVVETFDAGRLADGSAYVLMELLAGRSLYEATQDRGTIEARRLASIMAQVAEGMVVAHAAGIIHRDLKPENIFLVDDPSGDARVKVLDFGVSKFDFADAPSRLTAEGTLVGTPYYMSSEQASGKEVDARTDVYAMGVMLYEALTGKLPFEASTVGELFVRIGAGECVPLSARCPDLEPAWFELVARAMHKDVEQRFQSAEALRRALLPLASSEIAKRAQTISDGARSTISYDEPLPPAPALPREMEPDLPLASRETSEPPAPPSEPEPASEPETEPESDFEPAAVRPPPASGRIPAWAYAIGGAVLMLALAVSWQLSREPQPSPPPVELAAPPEPPPVVEAPVEPPSAPTVEANPDAGSPIAEPRRRGRRDPASAAGLDPNPYP